MKLKLMLLVVLLATVPLFAQAPASAPKLTPIEQNAIQNVAQNFNQLNTQIANLKTELAVIVAEINKNHPGYHIELTNFTLVKDVPPVAPKPKP